MSDAFLVKELSLLDEIEAISESYQERFGLPPKNVSTWDPSDTLPNLNLLSTLPPVSTDGKAYIFSYTLMNHQSLRLALGYQDSLWESLVSHSGSANIVMICNWLRVMGAERILILGPRYFTVPHCLTSMGINFETKHCVRTSHGYRLPSDVNPDEFDGFWITHPIYGTGVNMNWRDIANLHDICRSADRFFVLDECLAKTDSYIGPKLPPHSKTAVIAAPHKSVCVNAYKFSISLFHVTHLAHFEHWSDVWLGCLPQSSQQAIQHFLGNGFQQYQNAFESAISKSSAQFKAITKSVSRAEIDETATGYFRTVYFPDLPSALGVETAFLRRATFETGATFIPGIRNELDPRAGFSFRVNLAAFDNETRSAYMRLLQWLASMI